MALVLVGVTLTPPSAPRARTSPRLPGNKMMMMMMVVVLMMMVILVILVLDMVLVPWQTPTLCTV